MSKNGEEVEILQTQEPHLQLEQRVKLKMPKGATVCGGY